MGAGRLPCCSRINNKRVAMIVMKNWNQPDTGNNRRRVSFLMLSFILLAVMEGVGPLELRAREAPKLVFAVVTEKPVQRNKLQAQVLSEGKVKDALLVPSEAALRNPMWKTIEMCQGVKAEAIQSPSGYEIIEFRILGASMLPMPLQAVAGDCFLKKALEYAPLVE